MFKYYLRITLFFLILFTGETRFTYAQTTVRLKDSVKQHIFEYNEIKFLEDTSSALSFDQVRLLAAQNKFNANKVSTPVASDPGSVYWYRMVINYSPANKNNWILEFFDQTTDNVTVYEPGPGNHYKAMQIGYNRLFDARPYQHKNLSVNLNPYPYGDKIYYIRVHSHKSANVIIVLRSMQHFIHYALDEYFLFGIFYGMILVFAVYNLIMFIAIGQRQYLYYIVYNIGIGVYEMCADGVAFQYLWPDSPGWNNYVYGIALFIASLFGILFAQSLLSVKTNAPRLNKLIQWVIAGRCIFFLLCLTVNKNWFDYKVVEIIPLSVAFMTGCYILYKGYKPARLFVVGYFFLMIGFVMKALIALHIWTYPVTAFEYYSLSFCLILEMFLVSFALGDRIRLIRAEKDLAQQRAISQLQQNEELMDALNKGLEDQVQERTQQLVQKTSVIELQNAELTSVNRRLQEQAEEISRMNVLLEMDNTQLQSNIEKVTHDRAMSAGVDFEEFSKIYPDRETCFKFLSDLKWEKGYDCRKCSGKHYGHGQLPYSRRCSKCGYEESVIAYTILQNTRIPINKAFYIIFLMYSTGGKISSHKLSEILSIRQSTCWAYSSRIKKIMNSRKKELSNAGDKGWSKLVVETI
jgi:hypothetical protein